MPNEHKPDPVEDKPHPKVFHIQIDREHYDVESAEMTGAQLRRVPTDAHTARARPVRGRTRPP